MKQSKSKRKTEQPTPVEVDGLVRAVLREQTKEEINQLLAINTEVSHRAAKELAEAADITIPNVKGLARSLAENSTDKENVK